MIYLHQDAHEKYSRELVAHAESVKQINAFKEELTEAQAKAREHQTQAETAIARANASETTWASQKEILIKEMEEISARCKDLTSQNAALHQHLETVSSQAARIRQATEASTSNVLGAGTNETDPDDAAAELRGVITFVRREKEIAELQLDLHKQENTRLKSYSDHLAQSLETARNLLKEVCHSSVSLCPSIQSSRRNAKKRLNQPLQLSSTLTSWKRLISSASFVRAIRLCVPRQRQTRRQPMIFESSCRKRSRS